MKLASCFAVTGALSFWLPDVAIHIAARMRLDAAQVKVITLLVPVTFLCAYLVARRFALRRNFGWVGAVMLIGVWLTGGAFMAIGATPAGGGFAGPDGVRGGFFMAMLGTLPPVTYIMSAYDGSLLALLAVTGGAMLVWAIRSSGMPLPFRCSPKIAGKKFR